MDGPRVDRFSAPSPFIGITLPITPNLLKWSPLDSRRAHAPHGRGGAGGAALSAAGPQRSGGPAQRVDRRSGPGGLPATGRHPTVAAKDCLPRQVEEMVVRRKRSEGRGRQLTVI